MATAEKGPATRTDKPLVPPDERFWKRYSAHMELPLASATSIFVHGLILGFLALGGLAFLFRGAFDPTPPAKMDALLVDAAGIGGEPGGAPSGEPGFPGAPAPDLPQGPPGPSDPADGLPEGASEPSFQLPTIPSSSIDVPPPESAPDTPSDVDTILKKIKDAADKQGAAKPKATRPPGSQKGASGSNNPKGIGGQGGPGGIGKGKRPGPGTGEGGVGRKATAQEIKAWRWRFDLVGSPKQHADKLERTGVLVAVPEPNRPPDPRTGPHLFITDLKRRPVKLEKGDFNKYADAVKWYNNRPESVRGLAQELKLPFVPAYVVLLLPKDREEKMAAEEKRFAEQHHHNLDRVRETWFDFRLQNGVYEPVVTRQEVQ